MNAHSRTHVLAAFLSITLLALNVGAASAAAETTCSNSCVTMAIPREVGVHTKLDGTADAVLWPPSEDLRKIRISALNENGIGCDVTITDVQQDEAPLAAGDGVIRDDATNCTNYGVESSVDLRSDRALDGNGRAYHILIKLDDPDCLTPSRDDDVLIVVPRDAQDESVTNLRPSIDGGAIAASYNGTTLPCESNKDDSLALNE